LAVWVAPAVRVALAVWVAPAVRVALAVWVAPAEVGEATGHTTRHIGAGPRIGIGLLQTDSGATRVVIRLHNAKQVPGNKFPDKEGI
jgi:hypothetical protein